MPTKHNVADEATKWRRDPSTDVESRWFRGSSLLYLPESLLLPFVTDEVLSLSLVPHERVGGSTEEAIRWEHRFPTNYRRRITRVVDNSYMTSFGRIRVEHIFVEHVCY